MTRIPAVLLAVALTAQAGCAGRLSSNQSNGMMYAGGATTFMGAVVVADSLSCNDVAGGEEGCSEDDSTLKMGLAVVGVGVVLGVVGYLLRPQPHAEATTTSVASE